MSLCKSEYLLSDKKFDSCLVGAFLKDLRIKFVSYDDGIFFEDEPPPETSYYLTIQESSSNTWHAASGGYVVHTSSSSKWSHASIDKPYEAQQFKIKNIYNLSNSIFGIKGNRINSIMNKSEIFIIDINKKILTGYIEDTLDIISLSNEISVKEFDEFLKKKELAEKLTK